MNIINNCRIKKTRMLEQGTRLQQEHKQIASIKCIIDIICEYLIDISIINAEQVPVIGLKRAEKCLL
ncbi:hypothetical protein BpHYR1_028005 [Brachionus plicatilis]|uniref:Uncharacterized protein n=1 Tax=Brachionus plicatilis TaxID=10195 RepID=A0A3M7RKR3_BRAPC|nr:hypothetical protein BpHYR1_028005 [Brachionus plicatilis]